MSADRWSDCPKCFDINSEEIERLQQIIRDYESGSGRPTDKEEDAFNKAEVAYNNFPIRCDKIGISAWTRMASFRLITEHPARYVDLSSSTSTRRKRRYEVQGSVQHHHGRWSASTDHGSAQRLYGNRGSAGSTEADHDSLPECKIESEGKPEAIR